MQPSIPRRRKNGLSSAWLSAGSCSGDATGFHEEALVESVSSVHGTAHQKQQGK
jgi:hypothetical protein